MVPTDESQQASTAERWGSKGHAAKMVSPWGREAAETLLGGRNCNFSLATTYTTNLKEADPVAGIAISGQ